MSLAAGQLDAADSIEEAARSARRSRNREYDRLHRTELRAKTRDRYKARIRRVGADILRAARQDPRYEEKHAIAEYVICRLEGCGAKAKQMTSAHLRNFHRMNTARYMKLFPGAPLLSSAAREGIGSRNTGRRLRKTLRLSWLIAEGVVHGKPFAEIAKQVDTHRDWARHYAAQLGLGSGWRRFDLGSRVTNGSQLQLLKGTGLNSRQFAEVFAVPRSVAEAFLNPNAANHDVSPTHAKSIIDARDRLISEIEWLSLSTAHRWGPNLAKCVRSLIPDLPPIFKVLRSGLALTRRYLRANPKATIADWQDWLCDEALREIKQKRRDAPFAAFLPLAAELSPMIEAEFGSIRSVGRIVYVAARVLGARFSVGYSAILHGARSDRLPSLELKVWILSALNQKREPGRRSERIYQKALVDMKKGATLRQVTEKYLASYYRRDSERAMAQMKSGIKRRRQKLQ